jgi:hypothetical protein
VTEEILRGLHSPSKKPYPFWEKGFRNAPQQEFKHEIELQCQKVYTALSESLRNIEA